MWAWSPLARSLPSLSSLLKMEASSFLGTRLGGRGMVRFSAKRPRFWKTQKRRDFKSRIREFQSHEVLNVISPLHKMKVTLSCNSASFKQMPNKRTHCKYKQKVETEHQHPFSLGSMGCFYLQVWLYLRKNWQEIWSVWLLDFTWMGNDERTIRDQLKIRWNC